MSNKTRVEEIIKEVLYLKGEGENYSNIIEVVEEYCRSEIDEITKAFDSFKQAIIRADNLNSDLVWEGENEKPLRVQLEDKISELTKEVSEITKHKDYAEKVSYQTSTDNAKLIGKITELKEEVERLNKERDNSLKEKMYFNRMKELVSKVAYDSEHYTQKTYEVLRNDAIGLLDEYKLNTH